MINTTFTLTTACFKLNNDGRSLDEVLDATNSLMAISVYLVIYGDKETLPILRALLKTGELNSSQPDSLTGQNQPLAAGIRALLGMDGEAQPQLTS